MGTYVSTMDNSVASFVPEYLCTLRGTSCTVANITPRHTESLELGNARHFFTEASGSPTVSSTAELRTLCHLRGNSKKPGTRSMVGYSALLASHSLVLR